MTAQTALTASILVTLAVFTVSFLLDLFNVTRKAWDATKPQAEIETKQEAPTPKTETKFASLDWVQPSEEEYTLEEVNIIEIAKDLAPKPETKPEPQPRIVTLPQTAEAKALEQWLNQRPDYSKMTVKQLRKEAKVRCIKNAGVMLKKELIEALAIA